MYGKQTEVFSRILKKPEFKSLSVNADNTGNTVVGFNMDSEKYLHPSHSI